MEAPLETQTATIEKLLENQRTFFQSGATRILKYRLDQLEKLRKAIKKYDAEVQAALKADLNKGTFEAYASETGFVLEEIKHAERRGAVHRLRG
jgi:aldehyde dehydrogenase (NAD+)